MGRKYTHTTNCWLRMSACDLDNTYFFLLCSPEYSPGLVIFVFCERTGIATPHARGSNPKNIKYKIYHTLPGWLNTAVKCIHNDTPSASLAVWMYIVPNKTTRCSLLLGRDSWMRFHTRSYQTLAPAHDGRIFGELTPTHTFDNVHNNSTAAYIHSCCETPDAAHHLVYDGPGMSLTTAPQLLPVNLVRLDGSPALTGHYIMVDIATTHNGQDPLEHFVASGRQTIPLTGHRDLEPGDILGTASHQLLRVPLATLAPHDTQHEVTTIAESPVTLAPPSTATNVTPDTSDDLPTELLHRLDDVQRESFLRLWNTVPPHIRQIDFALDAPCWEPSAIDALGATLTEYADIFPPPN